MKYPRNKPLQGDGPACRVCGCTERRACGLGCSWVKEPSYTYDFMPPLCSACEGTPDDLAYLMRRFAAMLSHNVMPRGITRARMRLLMLAAARRAEKRMESEHGT